MQQRYHEVRAHDDYLETVLQEGAAAANQIASQTLLAARVAMGFAIRKQ
jgi:hypothetical protein